MPGFMRRTMSYLGLVEDYDDDGFDYEDEYDSRRDRSADRDRGSRRGERPSLAPVVDDDGERRPSTPAVVEPIRADLSRITTVHPRTYNDARTIGEQFRSGIPVIMNLTEMGDADAKRLVDFSAGLTFGQRGSIDRVTSRVFLLSPPDISVTAEDKARIAEGGFYNQS
ncbi:MAG: DUF552 domain-containing protein [Streptosporangiales bacterium]|nr:DUF552 domain-containing protein [Streptosporangiales bacterium]